MRKLTLFGSAGVALVLASIFGCRSAEQPGQARQDAWQELRSYVEAEVSDPDRRGTALGLLDQLDAELRGLQADAEVFRAELAELSPRYETTSEQLLARYDAAVKARRARREQMVDLHFQLREALTEAAWPGYVERELQLVRLSLAAPRQGSAAGLQDESEEG